MCFGADFSTSMKNDNKNGLRFFVLDSRECSLKEMDWGRKADPIIIKGEKSNFGMDVCVAYVKNKTFEKNYEFCTANGSFLRGRTGEVGCSFGNSGKYFFQTINDVSCYYMCKEKKQ